jgi:hypothetical protein
MPYPHKLSVQIIPVPKDYIQVVIESDIGPHTTSKELYATPEEFLEFWKPLIEYYEGVKNANSIKNG